jgi:hypothetical protein
MVIVLMDGEITLPGKIDLFLVLEAIIVLTIKEENICIHSM